MEKGDVGSKATLKSEGIKRIKGIMDYWKKGLRVINTGCRELGKNSCGLRVENNGSGMAGYVVMEISLDLQWVYPGSLVGLIQPGLIIEEPARKRLSIPGHGRSGRIHE